MPTNLIIEQGADWQPSFQYLEQDGVTPVNLTGYTARMQIRKTVADANKEADLTTENAKLSISGATGEVFVHLSAAETRQMNFVTAVYDLELVAPDGVVTRLAAGAVALSLEVTR